MDSIIWPTGITMDNIKVRNKNVLLRCDVIQNNLPSIKERLYWLDVKLHSISSCQLDGSDVSVLPLSEKYLIHPWSVAISEDFIFWSDWSQTNSSIYRANKRSGDKPELLTSVHMLHKPLSLKVYHATAQPSQKNLCQSRKVPCSHFCTVTPDLKTR